MKALFITGTDTGVGKTVVTGLLGRWLIQRGYNVVTQKWIQTGKENDLLVHLRMMGKLEELREYMELMSPCRFKFPSSPHLASSIEGERVDWGRIMRAFTSLCEGFEIVLVEGVGGVLVPVGREILLIDMVKEAGLPVLIVALNRLGAINHTLLTLEALKNRGIDVVGVIFNNILQDEDRTILDDNPKIISHIGRVPILGVLEYGEEDELWEGFLKIGEEIHRRWMNG
jgi:dethiobiotin synthetase